MQDLRDRGDQSYVKMRRCIYCLQEKFAGDFNADHVVPQQLGHFDTNASTLHCVCRDCNQYFGDTVERLLGRDSYEGLERLVHGIKPATSAAEFVGERVEFRIPEGSLWEGVRLYLGASDDGTRVIHHLPPQIGIRSDLETTFRFFFEQEFIDQPVETVARKRSYYVVVAPDHPSEQRLIAILKQRVPELVIHGPMPPPPLDDGELIVEVRATLDKQLARAIAKIGFNYLAYTEGEQFILRSTFDGVREFIRYGRGERRHFVELQNQPILSHENTRYRTTRAHIVAVEWHQMQEIRARVSPFNEMVYEISLCSGFDGLWRPIESGHLFDWEDHTVTPIASGRRSVHPIIQPILLFPP